jgi:hypothetical protein
MGKVKDTSTETTSSAAGRRGEARNRDQGMRNRGLDGEDAQNLPAS